MAEITADAVKALRERTGCPMMECKKALTEAKGDPELATELLRKRGLASAQARQDKQATEGCVASQIAPDGKSGTLVELLCQTDFVARNADFVAFAEAAAKVALAQRLGTPAEVLKAKFPGGTGTFEARLTELFTALREKLELRHVVRQAVPAGQTGWVDAYVHHNRKVGALARLAWDGPGAPAKPPENAGYDVCLQIVARPPLALRREAIAADVVERERRIQSETEDLLKKPEAVRQKIVEGRLSKWFQELVLIEQPFVKDDKQSVATHLAKVGGGRLSIAEFARVAVGT